MSRTFLALVAISCLSIEATASDPTKSRPTKNSVPASQKAPNPYLVAVANAKKVEEHRVWSHVCELTLSPTSFVVKYYCDEADPNDRMAKLLRESEDLRQARAEWHKFWMNNQPAVLTYERLAGGIGP